MPVWLVQEVEQYAVADISDVAMPIGEDSGRDPFMVLMKYCWLMSELKQGGRKPSFSFLSRVAPPSLLINGAFRLGRESSFRRTQLYGHLDSPCI